jgi:hypothetical protein
VTALAPLDLARDINVIKLAREVAIDHFPIQDILDKYRIDEETWEALQRWPRFNELVDYERQQWNSALNTNTRVKLKSATVIEEWMEHGHQLLHDASQTFGNKIELVKILGKFAGLEAQEKTVGETAAGRVTINIKIGDQQLEFDDGQVIDAVPVENIEESPDEITFDWEEEFPVNPTEDAEAVFAAE